MNLYKLAYWMLHSKEVEASSLTAANAALELLMAKQPGPTFAREVLQIDPPLDENAKCPDCQKIEEDRFVKQCVVEPAPCDAI